MARGRFTQDGWRRIQEQVGSGWLTGKLRVDQIYAKYQHERLDLAHPHGGGAKYLERPLNANHSDYFQRLAGSILEGDPARTMAECMEALNTAMSAAAPVDLNNLRRSGNPKVFDNGREVYNRPAWQRRMSDHELRALRRGRGRRRR
jgi:hypothetical protein